ncbi:MAG: hypothetical protein IJB74_10400 [Clostridia bacterium]|nr:hypothetical protein [Clostridia bacterium]
MSNKCTKNNHYVSIGFAKNFRTQKSDMWKLDCISGDITNRSTSAERLFAGRKLWSQDLEDAYNTLENQVIPLIDEILLLPFKPVASSNAVEIEVLPDKYKKVLDYILQTTILQNIAAVCRRQQKTLLRKYVLRYANDDEFNAKPIQQCGSINT